MIGAFKRLWGRDRAVAHGCGRPLPPAFAAKLKQKSFGAVQPEWQDLLRSDPEHFESAIAAARSSGWPATELRRLSAFGRYYRGELDLAVGEARDDGLTFDAARFDPDLFLLVISCLFHRGQIEDAWRTLTALEARHPSLQRRADFWQSKAALQHAGNDLRGAWRSLHEARRFMPDDAGLAMNVYSLAFQLEEWKAFSSLDEEIRAGRYGDALNAFAMATPHLARHDYATGFDLLEKRYAQADAPQYVNPALLPGKRWTGRFDEYPVGCTLLLTCEQGFGDAIMMARYFPRIAEATAGGLVIEVQRELLPLFETNFPQLRFCPREHGKPPPVAFDLWAGAMSLPSIFASTAETIPGKAGYLAVPHDSRAYWRKRCHAILPVPPRIGLAWSGNPRHLNDRQRSIPFARVAERVAAMPGQLFVAVQTSGLPADRPGNLVDAAEELITFADTAAMLEALDLVITVDTSLVHLAGAMGKETWLLLPHRYEWRWGLEGEGNAWYDSVKVLRQTSHGDWDGLLAEVFTVRLPAWLKEEERR